jgi:hypothetical protein
MCNITYVSVWEAEMVAYFVGMSHLRRCAKVQDSNPSPPSIITWRRSVPASPGGQLLRNRMHCQQIPALRHIFLFEKSVGWVSVSCSSVLSRFLRGCEAIMRPGWGGSLNRRPAVTGAGSKWEVTIRSRDPPVWSQIQDQFVYFFGPKLRGYCAPGVEGYRLYPHAGAFVTSPPPSRDAVLWPPSLQSVILRTNRAVFLYLCAAVQGLEPRVGPSAFSLSLFLSYSFFCTRRPGYCETC